MKELKSKYLSSCLKLLKDLEQRMMAVSVAKM